jgi:hypothetical protein
MLLFLRESFELFWGIVRPGIESESIPVFPAGAKESDSLFYDFSRIVLTLLLSVALLGLARLPHSFQIEAGIGKKRQRSKTKTEERKKRKEKVKNYISQHCTIETERNFQI